MHSLLIFVYIVISYPKAFLCSSENCEGTASTESWMSPSPWLLAVSANSKRDDDLYGTVLICIKECAWIGWCEFYQQFLKKSKQWILKKWILVYNLSSVCKWLLLHPQELHRSFSPWNRQHKPDPHSYSLSVSNRNATIILNLSISIIHLYSWT